MSTIDSGPLAGSRLSYLFVDVHDLEVMLVFYRDVLGLPVVFEGPGACAFLELGGGPQLALYTGRKTGASAAAHFLFAIDVTDVEASGATLRERGVDVGAIRGVPGGRALIFTDPEGNRLEIHQPD
jgi:predicted enzyme related to lactoylglutathione lyase